MIPQLKVKALQVQRAGGMREHGTLRDEGSSSRRRGTGCWAPKEQVPLILTY